GRHTFDYLGRKLVETDALCADAERTGEIQQRVDRTGQAMRLTLGARNLVGRFRRRRLLRQPKVAEDREERVAELVGDAGGNLAEADQVLEIADAPLHRPDRGQIGEQPEEAEEPALFEKWNGGDS